MRCGGRCISSKGRKWPGSCIVLGSPVAAEALVLEFVVPLPLLRLAELAVGLVAVLDEEGGRQKSSNRSASREECMWRYVAEESRDWNIIASDKAYKEKDIIYHLDSSKIAEIRNSQCPSSH
jgi:hypothetical protein